MKYSPFILAALIGFVPIVSADQSQDSPFVVVELFSSQGCSSCPAAEVLVSKLTAWARQNNQPVYPLVFHVDYWNADGWRDIFSSPAYTQRQASYARVFKDQQVYTPEMVINGTDAFTGSDQEHLQKDLNNELSMPANVILLASLEKQNDQAVIKYSAKGFLNGDVVNFALVERSLSTDVTSGENDGRTLHQDNVVRDFQTMRLKLAPAQIVIPLNKISDFSQASVIIYVQNPQTMLIEAAKQLDLGNE